MPDDDHDGHDHQPAPPPPENKQEQGAATQLKPASTPAERWLTPNELETLRSRLKKRFH